MSSFALFLWYYVRHNALPRLVRAAGRASAWIASRKLKQHPEVGRD